MTTKVLPELGEFYTTHKSHEEGWVCEIVPNPSGTFRLRLRTVELKVRWTTWVPYETEEA